MLIHIYRLPRMPESVEFSITCKHTSRRFHIYIDLYCGSIFQFSVKAYIFMCMTLIYTCMYNCIYDARSHAHLYILYVHIYLIYIYIHGDDANI